MNFDDDDDDGWWVHLEEEHHACAPCRPSLYQRRTRVLENSGSERKSKPSSTNGTCSACTSKRGLRSYVRLSVRVGGTLRVWDMRELDRLVVRADRENCVPQRWATDSGCSRVRVPPSRVGQCALGTECGVGDGELDGNCRANNNIFHWNFRRETLLRMLLDLPVEILSEVLVLLDHLSILHCSAVCRHLHALVATSLNLQYRIELAAEGLIDGSPGGPAYTTAARMDLLLERRVAWRALRPRRRASVALAGHCHAYELVGGLFAKALEEYGAARRLVASWLPSNTTDETRLVVDDLGVRIKDFALDPAQDLIVLLEHRPAVGPSANTSAATAGADIRVHLRKLSAGAVVPHPEAKVPVLCRRALGPVHGCMIQIVEDVVGMYFWMPLHGVLIWNWMAGEELVFIQEDQAPERIWDFSFLSPRAYMVTTLKDGGEIRIYSFASPSSFRRPAHVATLHLPTPHPNRALFELTTTTGPFLARPPAGSPFSFSRTARVHVFTLHHDPGAHRGRWQPACFVVHNRTLMRYVETYQDDGPVDVPWEEWGPAGTRFFVLANGFQWLRYVHGTRVVCPVLQPSGESRVEVLDMNVHASRAPTAAEKLAASRLGIDLEKPVEGSRLVCEPSVFPASGVFAKEVITRLPYYSVPAPGQGESYVGYMIDEQRLLGLKASPFTDGDLGDVDVFTF